MNDVNLTDPTRVNGHYSITNNLFDGIPSEYHDCAVILGKEYIDVEHALQAGGTPARLNKGPTLFPATFRSPAP